MVGSERLIFSHGQRYEKSVNIMIVCIFLYFIDEIRHNQRTLTYRSLFLIRSPFIR
jgi:hypothetical protein